MIYQVTYRPYRRPFRQPLRTHHGTWSEREGIVLRLTDIHGHVGFGEIAPLPTFGSESLAQALVWCASLNGQCSSATLDSIPAHLPACQFGFEAAVDGIAIANSSHAPNSAEAAYCRLLPTGPLALDAWKQVYRQGDRTFKWKIGVAPIQTELAVFEKLIHQLPVDVNLRLDANGGLSDQEAHEWLTVCDRLRSVGQAMTTIELIEQPLPPNQFESLLQLSQEYQTPIALDESVGTFTQLQTCYQLGWRGIVVIKPAIAGYPSRVREFCRAHHLDVVWSSVFETAIARRYILDYLVPSVYGQTAYHQSADSMPKRALGFGTQQYLDDSYFDDGYFGDSLASELGPHHDDLNALFNPPYNASP